MGYGQFRTAFFLFKKSVGDTDFTCPLDDNTFKAVVKRVEPSQLVIRVVTVCDR